MSWFLDQQLLILLGLKFLNISHTTEKVLNLKTQQLVSSSRVSQSRFQVLYISHITISPTLIISHSLRLTLAVFSLLPKLYLAISALCTFFSLSSRANIRVINAIHSPKTYTHFTYANHRFQLALITCQITLIICTQCAQSLYSLATHPHTGTFTRLIIPNNLSRVSPPSASF